jgi:predicted NBD/HSP70 family sugar kinase/biotin operon repressor
MPRMAPARPALLRTLNDRTVLGVLLDRGPSSRAELAEATGLSKPTVTEVLSRLEDAGLILDAGETVGRRGPNGRLHDIVIDHVRGAALTVEPSRITCAVLDARGRLLGSATRTRAQLPRGAAAATRALVAEAAGSGGVEIATVREVVVAVPGSYDPAHDRVRYADRIPDWTTPGIAASVGTAFGGDVAVTLDNDVNLALVAERAGDAAGAGVTSLLWLSSGIGLATDVAGTLYRGVAGGAGEIGYIPVPARASAGGPRAGQPDFQDLVGGVAVLALARAHGTTARTPVAAVERAVALHQTDPAARAFLDELAGRLALGLAVIVGVLDPGVVVLGGAVGRAGGRALATRTSRALRATSRLTCAVVASTVDGDPALVGARMVAAERVRDRVLDAGDHSASTHAEPLPRTSHPQSQIPLPRTAKEVH